MPSPEGAAPRNTRAELFGISAAMVTPFGADGSPDLALAAEHAGNVLDAGARSVTLFGTTGEGASLSNDERTAMLQALIAAGIPPSRIGVAICATSVAEASAQARAAMEAGVSHLLVLPPFYYKGVSDAALYDWFSAVLEPLVGTDARAILYHIPQITAVPLSLALIRQLKERFGSIVFGVKDSSGDWDNAKALLAYDDLAVLIGDERHLAQAATFGAAGAISGIANLFPARLAEMLRTGEDDAEIRKLVDAVVALPVTPAVKATVGALTDKPQWRNVRAPLDPTPQDGMARLGDIARAIPQRKAA